MLFAGPASRRTRRTFVWWVLHLLNNIWLFDWVFIVFFIFIHFFFQFTLFWKWVSFSSDPPVSVFGIIWRHSTFPPFQLSSNPGFQLDFHFQLSVQFFTKHFATHVFIRLSDRIFKFILNKRKPSQTEKMDIFMNSRSLSRAFGLRVSMWSGTCYRMWTRRSRLTSCTTTSILSDRSRGRRLRSCASTCSSRRSRLSSTSCRMRSSTKRLSKIVSLLVSRHEIQRFLVSKSSTTRRSRTKLFNRTRLLRWGSGPGGHRRSRSNEKMDNILLDVLQQTRLWLRLQRVHDGAY